MNKVTVHVLLQDPSSQPGLLLRSPGLGEHCRATERLLCVLREGNRASLPCPWEPMAQLPARALCPCWDRAPCSPGGSRMARDAGAAPQKIPPIPAGWCCQAHCSPPRFSPDLCLPLIWAAFVQLFLHCCTWCLWDCLCRILSRILERTIQQGGSSSLHTPLATASQVCLSTQHAIFPHTFCIVYYPCKLSSSVFLAFN